MFTGDALSRRFQRTRRAGARGPTTGALDLYRAGGPPGGKRGISSGAALEISAPPIAISFCGKLAPARDESSDLLGDIFVRKPLFHLSEPSFLKLTAGFAKLARRADEPPPYAVLGRLAEAVRCFGWGVVHGFDLRQIEG